MILHIKTRHWYAAVVNVITILFGIPHTTPCFLARMNRIVVANLMLEYVLANAAVARSFAGYFANLIGKESSYFIIPYRGYDLDFWAFALVLFHMVLLCLGTSESALFNLGTNSDHRLFTLGIFVPDQPGMSPQSPVSFSSCFLSSPC
jgi:amino acid transporter